VEKKEKRRRGKFTATARGVACKKGGEGSFSRQRNVQHCVSLPASARERLTCGHASVLTSQAVSAVTPQSALSADSVYEQRGSSRQQRLDERCASSMQVSYMMPGCSSGTLESGARVAPACLQRNAKASRPRYHEAYARLFLLIDSGSMLVRLSTFEATLWHPKSRQLAST
jgi:hypothetical protein